MANQAPTLATASTPTAAPEGLADGIYFVVTHWLAPIGATFIEAAVTVLVIAAGTAIERKYKITGGSIVSIFNQILQILGGTADAFGVPNASGIATTPEQLANLQSTLNNWPTA